MPKETFFHLPAEKREAILFAIREELRRVSFDNISINRIIRDAGIPRGSFYQYFEDKDDLIAYVMDQINALIQKKLRLSLQESGGDIFHVFSASFRCMLEVREQPETADIFRNFLADFRPCANRTCTMLGSRIARTTLEGIRRYVNIDQLNLREENDLQNMLEVLQAITQMAIANAFLHPEEADGIEADYHRKLSLLKEGFLRQQQVG